MNPRHTAYLLCALSGFIVGALLFGADGCGVDNGDSARYRAENDSLRAVYATRDSLSAAEIRHLRARTAASDSIAAAEAAKAAIAEAIADHAARGFREANQRADEALARYNAALHANAEGGPGTTSGPVQAGGDLIDHGTGGLGQSEPGVNVGGCVECAQALTTCTDARQSCAVALDAAQDLHARQEAHISSLLLANAERDTTIALLSARTVEVMGERDEALALSETINESLSVSERRVRSLTWQRNAATVVALGATLAALLK